MRSHPCGRMFEHSTPGGSIRHDVRFSRRMLLGGTPLALLAPVSRAAAQAIDQPGAIDVRAYSRRAAAMRDAASAAGDQPFGAVVVLRGRIVGEAPSRVVTARDPTAHAETEAIRDAARRLGTGDLSDAELYASSRPCPMCEAAAYWARIARIFVGEEAADLGTPRLSRC